MNICPVDGQKIHPTAVIDPTARLAEGVVIGPYAIIGAEVEIGPETKIAAHAQVGDYTRIGARCRIFAHAVVGSPSQDLKHPLDSVSWLEIGNDNLIREFVTINRATEPGASTRIGHQNLFMAYAHIAHDCQIGDRNVLANGATLGGHVTLADDITIGAMSGLHQFVRIGHLTMIGAMSRVCQDIPPYMLAVGNPPKVYGLNSIGLRRKGIPAASRSTLKAAYQLIYRKQLNLSAALEALMALPPCAEMENLLAFIHQSQRGLVSLFQNEVF